MLEHAKPEYDTIKDDYNTAPIDDNQEEPNTQSMITDTLKTDVTQSVL